ncbi:MAG: DUF1056 family protein [Lactobacillus sp.]|nr:DUF1056 family protein [Lactobacillus sp.]RMC46850.1 DUF1056 family protein [Lactobacillus sp. ESL0230]
MLIKTLFKLLWQLIDLLLFILGFGAIAYGAFMFNSALGFVVLGILLLVTGFIIDYLPQDKKGGD